MAGGERQISDGHRYTAGDWLLKKPLQRWSTSKLAVIVFFRKVHVYYMYINIPFGGLVDDALKEALQLGEEGIQTSTKIPSN